MGSKFISPKSVKKIAHVDSATNQKLNKRKFSYDPLKSGEKNGFGRLLEVNEWHA